jgi:HK97 family phage prohead protease
MKSRNVFPGEIKASGDSGRFTGYAAVFGNIDDGFDVIEAGAFKEFRKEKDGRVIVLHAHNTREYIGRAAVTQDEKGLHVDGELVLEDPLALRVHAHLKAGTISGMSIGYDVLPGGAEFTEAGIRRLKALKLWEVSVLPFGMNELARVEAVKQITTIREYEDFLRDAGGFSVRQARALAADGFKALQKARDEPDAGAQIAQLVEGQLFKLD